MDNPYYDATAPKYDGEWENYNPKKIWVPSKKGLGSERGDDTSTSGKIDIQNYKKVLDKRRKVWYNIEEVKRKEKIKMGLPLSY